MKRLWLILFALLLTASLFGCTQQPTAYTVTKNGIDFHIDRDQKTISEGDNVYQYKFSGVSSDFQATITYPNGSSYWESRSNGGGQSGWSNDYAEDAYVSGETLVAVLLAKAPKSVNQGKILGGVVLMALGVFNLIVPKASWYLGYGWRYKNAEPSDAALLYARIGGVIAAVAGIVLLLI